MWKSVFIAGMVLTTSAHAANCNINSIDDVAQLFSQSALEKEYQSSSLKLIESTKNRDLRRTRPELAVSFDADKKEFKNNELSVELMFDVDGYRKYGTLKEASEADAEFKKLESKNSSVDRVIESSLSYFKVLQSTYFIKKVDALLGAVKSSEDNYNRRPIKSRDDEIVLNSLRLIKDSLILKKTLLEDQASSNLTVVESFEVPQCNTQYEGLSSAIKNISADDFNKFDGSSSLKLQELKLKEEFVLKRLDFESRNRISNFKIGPVFSREVVQGETENRFGLGFSMDFPVFDNSDYINYTEGSKRLEKFEVERSKKIAQNQHKYLLSSLKKYSAVLKQISSSAVAENNINKMKKSFDMGVISPLVYLDSYRSYVDYLETTQEAEQKVFENYLKLRGAYAENNIF